MRKTIIAAALIIALAGIAEAASTVNIGAAKVITDILTTINTALTVGSVGVTYDSTGSVANIVVKASPGVLNYIAATNTNAEERYLYCENDTTGNTTPGSETVEFQMAIPGATTGSGIVIPFVHGRAFSVAWTCWLSTSNDPASAVAVAAHEIKLDFGITP